MSESDQKYLKIGELAKKTGVAVSAIRYYEEVDLLKPCFRNNTKYRFYLPSDVVLLNFINKSKRLGFSLEEIKAILHERNEGRSPCPLVREFAKDKIHDLQEKVKELQQLEHELNDYILEASSDLESGADDKKICGLIDHSSS